MSRKPKTISFEEKKGCLGKVQHKSELAAKNQLDFDIKDGVDNPNKYHYYKCKFCGFFHLGH